MSGREQDPVGTFLPSIDQDLIRDLDRHLRNAASPEEAPRREPAVSNPDFEPNRAAASHSRLAPPRPETTRSELRAPRPSTSDILDAVGQAASSMAAMNARIQELDGKQFELAATNNQLRTKLNEVLQSQQTFDTRLRTETERAERAEEIAARHLSRCQILEGDLSAALSDLTRIAEAINGTLGASQAANLRRRP